MKDLKISYNKFTIVIAYFVLTLKFDYVARQ